MTIHSENWAKGLVALVLVTFGLLTTPSWAQSTVLMPMPKQCFVDSSGNPLSGGKVFSYISGTSIQQATYTDSTGSTQNTNPVVLDAAGCGSIWLTSGVAYKFLVQNSFGVQQFTADNVAGLANTVSAAQQAVTAATFSPTPTFTALAQNQLFQMTLTGNVTSSSLVMSGISTPAQVTFQLSEDATGNRTFVWPANFAGAQTIDLAPNAVTTQSFFWDGTTAYALANSRSGGNDHALPGEVRMYAGSTAPSGWLLCDGSAVSRLTYASLFSVVGTTYGSGDGSSTFNLPDLRGRIAMGAGQGSGLSNRTLGTKVGEENHVLSASEMPSHTHSAGGLTVSETHSWGASGLPSKSPVNTALVTAGGVSIQQGTTNTTDFTQSFTTGGSTAATGGGAGHNNIQPSLVLNYICKF